MPTPAGVSGVSAPGPTQPAPASKSVTMSADASADPPAPAAPAALERDQGRGRGWRDRVVGVSKRQRVARAGRRLERLLDPTGVACAHEVDGLVPLRDGAGDAENTVADQIDVVGGDSPTELGR